MSDHGSASCGRSRRCCSSRTNRSPRPCSPRRSAPDAPRSTRGARSSPASYEERGAGHRSATSPAGGGCPRIPDAAPMVEQFVLSSRHVRLTKAALETLSIVAYKQPVTRHQISAIRGVNSDGVLRALVDRGLVAEVGREETPGRPVLYGTTPRVPRAPRSAVALGPAALAPLPARGRRGRGGRDGRRRLTADARRAAAAFARPRRVRVAPRVRGADRRRPCPDQRDGRDAGRPARPGGRRGRVDGSKVNVDPELRYVRAPQAARRRRRRCATRTPNAIIRGFLPEGVHVFPVGRLDRDTEGSCCSRTTASSRTGCTHPRYAIEKEYLAEVERAAVEPPALAPASRRGARRRDREGRRRSFGGRCERTRRRERARWSGW